MQTPSALLNGMLCFRETFPVCTALRRLTGTLLMGGLLWVVGSDLEGQSGRYLGQKGWSNKPHIVALLEVRGTAFTEECCACTLIVIFHFGNTLTRGSTNLDSYFACFAKLARFFFLSKHENSSQPTPKHHHHWDISRSYQLHKFIWITQQFTKTSNSHE